MRNITKVSLDLDLDLPRAPPSSPHPTPYYYYTFPHRKIRVIQFAGVLPRDVPSLPVAQPISFL